jgi:hypothetical protein
VSKLGVADLARDNFCRTHEPLWLHAAKDATIGQPVLPSHYLAQGKT